MKSIFASAFILLFSATSFAQSNVNTLKTESKSTPSQYENGLYLGLDYMNVTDIQMKTSVTSDVFELSQGERKSEGGTQLGLAGISIGYAKLPYQGFGFRAGSRFLESFNESEYGKQKLYMIVPELNAALALQRVVIYAGINASVWTGSSDTNDYRTQIGAQTGLGFRINEHFTVNAGYTIMRQKLENKIRSISWSSELQASGFNSNVVYTF